MSDRPRALTAAGDRWAIATPHRAATEAGVEAFATGGNAIDAALAAAVTLAVVYPHMCGVGGDLFALVQRPGGPTTAVNASGAAPMAIDAEALRRSGTAMPPHGPFSVTVPGAVSGWDALAPLGASLPFDRAFDAAIRLAAEGVPVAPSVAAALAGHPDRLAEDPGMAEVFFPGGHPLKEGTTLAQPALAATLEAVAREGPPTLYGGEVGSRLARGLAAAGSPITLDDLARHKAELASPLSGRYRDLLVSVAPPNSQGFVLLEILAAVERLGLEPDPLGPDAATLAEVFRAAGADRDRHNADPRTSDLQVATLLGEDHIAALCDRVRKHRAAPGGAVGAPRGTGDTIALVAADARGNAVSLIQSLFDGFGSGILEPATGIVAHSRGACFSLDPSSPNALVGGKRPAHTLMPVLVHRHGGLAAVCGSMGGYAQPQINAFSILRMFDLGLTPAAALQAPRWLLGGMDPESSSPFVEAEGRVPSTVSRALEGANYEVRWLRDLDEAVGHTHLIRVGPGGVFEAASDPRADGSAAAA